jgi:hypothetical protein
MDALALDRIDEYCESDLPVEATLDPYHPANDRFYKSKLEMERQIVHAQAILRPKQVLAVKAHFAGKTNVAAAKTIGVAQNTIAKYIKAPDAQRLLALLRHYRHHIDGPGFDHRKSFLWRIAVDNQPTKPSVAIAAITEINRMEGVYDKKTQTSSTITVIVNNDVLQSTTLDN